MLNQSAQSLQLGRLGSLRGDSAHRRELTGVQVHYLLDLLTAFPIEPVEAALALAPGVSGFYELRNYVRIPVHVPVRITFRETGQHALAHLRYEIQAHQVYQAKDPGLGSPCGTAQDCVRLLYPHSGIQSLRQRRLHPEGAHAVSDETRCVLALDHALAQAQVRKVHHNLERLWIRLVPGHNLQKPHVAGRIEEVSDQEIPGEGFRQSIHQIVQGYGGGVGGDNRTGLPNLLQFCVDILLDVQPLNHRFHYPVRFSQLLQIILKIPRSHQAGVFLVHECGRIGLIELLERRPRQHVPVIRVRRDDVQQQHGRPGVGQMSGDAAPHDSSTDDRRLGDTSNLGLVGLCHLDSLLPHLDRLQHGGYTLPPTYAHGGKRVLATLSPQQRGGLARDAPAAGTERMTKGNSSTVNIQLVRVYAQILNYRQGLGGEGLIDLYDIHVINGKSGPLQGLAAGGNRSYAHDLRRTPGHGYALNAGQRLQAVLLC